MASEATRTNGTIPNGTAEIPKSIIDQTPPPISQPYARANALDDLPPVVYALELFLASHMVESERYCEASDPERQRMYMSTGYGLIQCVKAFMTYADEDIVAAIGHTKHGAYVAQLHRRKAGLTSRLTGLTTTVASAFTGGEGSDIAWIRGMTPMERHAELVYAEALSEKAMLGVVYSGDWMAFIKEALNMRTTIAIYRSLYRFIQISDTAWATSHPGKEDPSLDAHFRSGVYLGYGLSTLILSLLPGKLQSIVELFGYHASRAEGLQVLGRAGGWGGKASDDDSSPPSIDKAKEGVRRPICDMILLAFHLVLSSFTTIGVSLPTASRLIKYYAQRFPRGPFYLFAQGRMALLQSRPADAIRFHQTALDAHQQFARLAAISYWERAIGYLGLFDIRNSMEEWKRLHEGGGWSKAVYAYGYAVCTYRVNQDEGDKSEESRNNVIALMKTIPELRQKIAGKSIPLEKLVARKARKFILQGESFPLPIFVMAYWFLAIAHAPRNVLVHMLSEVDGALKNLDAEPKNSHYRQGYWDDICLVRFLEGVCLRFLAFADSDAVIFSSESSHEPMSPEDAARKAEVSFKAVFRHGPKIEYDHHVVYYAHYELGRLFACQARDAEAHEQFDLVLSGRYLEVGPSGRKGRYSLENALHMKTRAAVEGLTKRAER
ncbi:hypothetical protein BDZ89DRAFT_949301 [Hymenopellis radicata]|nr:hypothetical protein BDZ89DRAFT_949301 [Hymenopellis radicata]